MDSSVVRAIPPLYAAWAPIGKQAVVPIVGSHDKRTLSGVLNILSGDWLTLVTNGFDRFDFQALLRRVRHHWRGWRIVLFLDRNRAHTAADSRGLAKTLHIELRWLPTACPELNVMDTLWRQAKAVVAANEPTPNVDATVQAVVEYIETLPPKARLRKAGVLAEDFWLADVVAAHVSKNFCGPT